MTDIAEGAKDLLVAAGVGTFGAPTGWGIFINKQPTTPDTVITAYASGGLDPNPQWLLDFPSLRVQVRGAPGGYVAAQSKAKDVKDALLGLPSQDLNGDRWVSVLMNGDILSLGHDEENRPLFSINFSLIIEPANVAGDNRVPL
jgi:hypothetical protein